MEGAARKASKRTAAKAMSTVDDVEAAATATPIAEPALERSPAVKAAARVEAAVDNLRAAVAHADQVIRDHPDYDGTAFGGIVGSYVLGHLGGILGVTARPRRDVPSLVDAVEALS